MLAACGGGSTHTTTVPQSSVNASGSNVQFSLLIPNAATPSATSRKPAYVSPSTLSGTIQVNGGVLQELDLSAGSTACTTVSGGRACIIATVAPIGSDTFSLVLYDGAFTGGVHTGTALSRASNFSSNVTEGSANVSLPLILGGIPASVDVTAGGTLTAGTATTLPLIVTAYDAQNNVIVGGAGYVDPSGAPLLTVAMAITTSQVTLHDGPQSGSSIAITSPADVTTLQLNAPATILGIPFHVTNGSGVVLPKHTSQVVAVNGTLTPTLLAAQFTEMPDYEYFAPMDASQATGMPNGFVFSSGTQSYGDYLGYFDSSTETLNWCQFNLSFNLAAAAVDGGLAVSYNGDYLTDTPPYGVAFYPKSTFVTGSCNSGTRYANAVGHPVDLAYDHANHRLFEADNNYSLAYDTFNGAAFSVRQNVLGSSQNFFELTSYNGITSFLNGYARIEQYQSSYNTYPTSSSVLKSMAIGPDGAAYALDAANKHVWVKSSLPSTFLFSSGAFSGAVSSQVSNLAIGPDGNAYTSDAASLIESLAPSGATASVTLPSIGGNVGYIRAVLDGKNGYIYAWYDDGLHNGTQNVYRISH